MFSKTKLRIKIKKIKQQKKTLCLKKNTVVQLTKLYKTLIYKTILKTKR